MPFATLYVGGGTPTALPSQLLERLLLGLRDLCALADDAEVTVEANPDDVTPELLATLRGCGVNRLSIGVQSFRDEELAFLGRRHGAARAREAILAAKDAGFQNLSLDLIYAFRGQRRDHWVASLDEACAWEPAHLSCYQLGIEPNTPMARKGVTRAPEGKEADFFLLTDAFLARCGFAHYEVSNFAREGFRSRHNSIYWNRLPYLGLGPSAHSFDGTTRWWNVESVDEYVARLRHHESPAAGYEVLSEEQHLLETLMLGLRTSDGVAVEVLSGLAGWEETAASLERAGLLVRRGERIVPTPQGMLVADRLPREFLGVP